MICTHYAWYPASWLMWNHLTGEVDEYHSITCTIPGCPGNVKERAEKQIQVLEKLTREERHLVGLLYKEREADDER